MVRRNKNVAAVALANKNARIIWALLTHDRQHPADCTGNHDVMARQVRPWQVQSTLHKER